jgi:MarR family 2-MHQ and catechol resistance regulon transcriptional repressor
MPANILDKISADLFSVPPLIFRGIRRKLLKPAIVDIDVDISPLHFEIMALLKEAGTLHLAGIGERLNIARAQMTHLIDRLVSLGIVERQMNTTDRRMTNIMLTGKGAAVLEEHEVNMKNAIKDTLSCLTKEDLESLSDSLRKLREIFSKLQ